MKNLRFETTPIAEISEEKILKMYKLGANTEVVQSSRQGCGSPCVRIDKGHYLDKRTGEVLEYSIRTKTRDENISSVRRSMKKLDRLIQANFVGSKNKEKHIVLTYDYLMTDVKKLYSDLQYFYLKLKELYGAVDYITVAEPQGTGSWHAHILLRYAKDTFIQLEDSNYLWGLGSFHISSISDMDNLGKYFIAYFSNLEVIEDTENTENTENSEIKKIKKGGRLKYYPVGLKLFRHSRSIKAPQLLEIDYSYFKFFMATQRCIFSQTLTIFEEVKNSCGETVERVINTVVRVVFTSRNILFKRKLNPNIVLM